MNAGHGRNCADVERRRSARRRPERSESLSRVRLRTGRELDVVDISAHGALLEGDVRLLPGTRIDLHVVTHAGRTLVRCRVMRAYVCALAAAGITYRIGVAFEGHVDIAAAVTTNTVPELGESEGAVVRLGTRFPACLHG